MNLHFNFHGSTYHAGLAKQDNNKLKVNFKDKNLQQKFGNSLPFYIENKAVNFNLSNRSHSDLYVLNSTISKAIKEQFDEIL